ncbi:hypothetical protein [Verminephrobacter aporrectodeae]|uniref:hypothetical protein n=1 Tax=Verminephrobacter aporrectodeae TaxID=1110389 RepID=UPI00023781F8|nr:hypothetical protein [Verminephrobacter aporrectodeae]
MHLRMGLVRSLLWWRLRHVAEVAYRLLVRRWQGVLFILLLLSPREMPIRQQLRVLAHPALVLTTPGPVATVLVTWVAMLALAHAWAQAQGGVLTGGAAWAFVQTQPVPTQCLRKVDLAVLAVCDLPLFLPFAAALAVLPQGPPAQRWWQGLALATVLIMLPVMQWAMHWRPREAMRAIAVQCVGLSCLAQGWSPAPFVLGSVATAWWMFRREKARAPGGVPAVSRPRRRAWALPPGAPMCLRLAWIDLRGLIGARQWPRHAALVAWAGLPWLVHEYLGAYGVATQTVTVAVVLTVMPLLFAVSGLAFELRRMHEPRARSTRAWVWVRATSMAWVWACCCSCS